MEFPLNLTVFWQERIQRDPALAPTCSCHWWAGNYKDAVDRINDHSSEDDPYLVAENADFDLLTEDNQIRDGNGSDYTPEEVRKMGFELLVLADLAEME